MKTNLFSFFLENCGVVFCHGRSKMLGYFRWKVHLYVYYPMAECLFTSTKCKNILIRKFTKRNDFFPHSFGWEVGVLPQFWPSTPRKTLEISGGDLVPTGSHAPAILFVRDVVNMPDRECWLRVEKQVEKQVYVFIEVKALP